LSTHRTTIYARYVHAKGRLGSAVAVGNVNGDRFADVVAGAPTAAVGTAKSAGKVVVFRGRSQGITASQSRTFSRASTHVPGTASTNDRFGAAVGLGDLTGDGLADVAIGVPGANAGGRAGAGVVELLRGTRSGVTASHSRQVSLATRHVPGAPSKRGGFGSAVQLLGPVNARARLLVGIPQPGGGEVLQLRGSRRLVTTRHARLLVDHTPRDRFGQALPS
jgi:hypothetical protein